MLGLASSAAATGHVGRQSRSSTHSSIGAARFGALRGVRMSLPGSLRAAGVTGEQLGFSRRALRLRLVVATGLGAIHSPAHLRGKSNPNPNTGLT
jgi:hypothetical protein